MRHQTALPRAPRPASSPAPTSVSAAAQMVRARPRSLAQELAATLGAHIRGGHFAAGQRMPTEASLMAEFGVSRTVVREAISQLQASGLVQTHHGIGTFVRGADDAAAFRIAPEQLATLQDVLAVLELRLALETEAAALAAERRAAGDLPRMRAALDAFAAAVEAGHDAVEADVQFHREIARATRNEHFADLLATLGVKILPRARLESARPLDAAHRAYLRRVHVEHERIFDAIAAGDAEAARAAMRTHLVNGRERRRRAALLPASADTPSTPSTPSVPSPRRAKR